MNSACALKMIHDRYKTELDYEPITLRLAQPEFLAWLSTARGQREPLGKLLKLEAAILRQQGNDEVADDLAHKSDLLLRDS